MLFQVGHTTLNLAAVTGHEYRRREGEAYRLALMLGDDGHEVEVTGPASIARVVEALGIEGPPPVPALAFVVPAREGARTVASGGREIILRGEAAEAMRRHLAGRSPGSRPWRRG